MQVLSVDPATSSDCYKEYIWRPFGEYIWRPFQITSQKSLNIYLIVPPADEWLECSKVFVGISKLIVTVLFTVISSYAIVLVVCFQITINIFNKIFINWFDIVHEGLSLQRKMMAV